MQRLKRLSVIVAGDGGYAGVGGAALLPAVGGHQAAAVQRHRPPRQQVPLLLLLLARGALPPAVFSTVLRFYPWEETAPH